MRRQMRMTEEQIREVSSQRLSERVVAGDLLVEKWSKKKNLGEGMDKIYRANPIKARNLAMTLENQEKHLKSLTETQISNAFSTAPLNVMKIIRLAYPNSVRGDLFTEWSMETAKDSIYYLTPVYGSTKRGANANTRIVESFADRYASETEEQVATGAIGTGNKTFTASLVNHPIRPFTVKVMVGASTSALTFVGTDDGSGNMTGATLDPAATNHVDYTGGTITINFLSAPTSGVVWFQYAFDSEDANLYDEIGEVQLQLQDYLFRARPFPLGVSWSKMTELLLGSTLNVDAEEALLQGAADEVKKSLDYFALRMGYRYAMGNAPVTFDANFRAAGVDSEMAHAQSMSRVLNKAGAAVFNTLGRGGVTNIYGGSDAVTFLMMHNRFDSAGAQPKIGAHKVGSIDGQGIYQCPTNIVPTNELITVWKNENVDSDSAILFGTLVPLYHTQKLEFQQMFSTTGVAYFGDYKCINPQYLSRIVLNF